MIRIYSAENLLAVEHARALLERDGIKSVIRNQYLAGGVGELPAFDCWPELWLIDTAQTRRAKQLIDGLIAPQSGAQTAWTCPQCSELIEGQFGQCWSCGGVSPQ